MAPLKAIQLRLWRYCFHLFEGLDILMKEISLRTRNQINSVLNSA